MMQDQSRVTNSSWLQDLPGYFLCIAGALLLVWTTLALVEGISTLSWTRVNGLIYQSRMINSTTNPTDREQAVFDLDLRYRYRVANQSYEGTDVYSTNIPLMGQERAETILAQYPVGSVQPVYINPSAPEQAVLIQGVSAILVLMLLPAIFCLVLGVQLLRKRG